jgi:hypothetical protein
MLAVFAVLFIIRHVTGRSLNRESQIDRLRPKVDNGTATPSEIAEFNALMLK